MSKEHYVVNCYTCQHNGQETCKGCNTLLNGEDEPYNNWRLREDLERKDNKISDLQSQLAEKDEQIKRRVAVYEKQFVEQTDEIYKLTRQLAEKDKEIEKILKENEELVIKYNVYNYGDKIQQDKVYSITGEALELLINRPNQKAIEQLEKVKDDLLDISSPYWQYFAKSGDAFMTYEDVEQWTKEFIDNQINELKEMK